jgi:hypothetical protein
MKEKALDNFYLVSLLLIIVTYTIFSGQTDYKQNPWLLTIEQYAIFFSYLFTVRRWFYSMVGKIERTSQWYIVNDGYIPLFEALSGLFLAIIEIIQLFIGILKGNISLHRIIFFLFGVLILWTRYKGFVDESDNCPPDEEQTDIPSDAGVDTVAVIIKCGTTGIVVDSDMMMHYWKYEYEYRVPGKDKIKKHRDTISFLGSAWGNWFGKYDVGFKFPIRYNKYSPKKHIRLHKFDCSLNT